MDPLRLHTVAARVVAWHNRHPLARRITVAQVHSVGYVALPYTTTSRGAVAIEPPLDEAPAPAAPMDALAQLRATMAESGSSLRERAAARAKMQGDAPAPAPAAAASPGKPGKPNAKPDAALQAAFSEDFIAPLKPREVARWAARHGKPMPQMPTDGPLRAVPAHGATGGEMTTLVVLTAAIEVGDVRHRVLLGAGDSTAVLGRRLYSRARTAGLSVGVLVSIGGTGIALRPPAFLLPALSVPALAQAAPESHAAATAPVPASTASAAPAAAPATSEASHEPAETAASHDTTPQLVFADAPASAAGTVAHAAAPASAAAGDNQRPIDVEPRLGRIALPALGLPHEAREAARQERLTRHLPPGTAPATPAAITDPNGTLPAAVAATAPSISPVAAPVARPPPPAHPSFAISTRVLRTRAEAEQMRDAMGFLLRGVGQVQVDVLPQGDDWRVVSWPFEQRDAAEKARGLLVARGMRVEVVDF